MKRMKAKKIKKNKKDEGEYVDRITKRIIKVVCKEEDMNEN